ncbi:hypothetical protein P152DRAFT_142592 [Eremomyces bilateralis CBS 781.70]|uniref:Altered inheritance of mitochondria protein 11 n=1 Tax=Eremomyces bilateralis CBS 781.70 TaxID=1392243 RepID=A0A6G1FW05_9PEZI|nr:uncharacterized protein P152DRAFT_142592 [Eremomyces bilateralis CBS 781.70]KAF1809886.1 hypothetical protein P152DRAFT_142592 [Eremomyces bilateralis CBS 781.70]
MKGNTAEASRSAQDAGSESNSRSNVDDSSILSARSRRQFSTFAFGATLCLVSAVLTKRTFVRRYNTSRPAFFEPSNNPPPPINAAKLAGEALGLATINVWSWAAMIGGGTLWAFDVSSMAEFRQSTRDALGWNEKEQAAQRQEQDMEDRIAKILERREAERQASK